MPLSWTDGQIPSTHLNAWCKVEGSTCGLIAAGPRNEAIDQVVAHFNHYHSDLTMVVQDEHFAIETAPDRCDCCNVPIEPPLWEYRIPPEIVPGDADGRWAVCDPCDALLRARDKEGFARRHWEQTLVVAPWLEHAPDGRKDCRAMAERTYAALTADWVSIRRDEVEHDSGQG